MNCSCGSAALSKPSKGIDDMKVAVVGGSSGIGKAVAERFKDHGSSVVVLDIQEPHFEGCDWVRTDLSDPESASDTVSKLEGPFAAWINSAGLPPRDGAQRQLLAVNFLGLVAATNAAIPLLSKGGSIVSIASRAGAAWRVNAKQISALLNVPSLEKLDEFIAAEQIDPVRAYALSKKAVIVWPMLQVSALISSGIRINTVSPAAVSTRLLPEFEAAFGRDRVQAMVARVGGVQIFQARSRTSRIVLQANNHTGSTARTHRWTAEYPRLPHANH